MFPSNWKPFSINQCFNYAHLQIAFSKWDTAIETDEQGWFQMLAVYHGGYWFYLLQIFAAFLFILILFSEFHSECSLNTESFTINILSFAEKEWRFMTQYPFTIKQIWLNSFTGKIIGYLWLNISFLVRNSHKRCIAKYT